MTDTPVPPTTIKAVCVARGKAYRLERDGRPVGMALAFANGRWGLFDLNEKRLSPIGFGCPKDVARAAQRRNLGA